MARAPQRIPRRFPQSSLGAADLGRNPFAPQSPLDAGSTRHLELVDPDARRRVRRRRWLVRLWAVGIVVAALSGVMVHAFMAEAQMRVDRIEQATQVEQARYQSARLRVSRLDSPAVVVSAAQRLGLIPAVTTRVVSAPGTQAAGSSDPTGTEAWQSAKPVLGTR